MHLFKDIEHSVVVWQARRASEEGIVRFAAGAVDGGAGVGTEQEIPLLRGEPLIPRQEMLRLVRELQTISVLPLHPAH